MKEHAMQGLSVADQGRVQKLIGELKAQLTCCICQDYFTRPMMANCGHLFCEFPFSLS